MKKLFPIFESITIHLPFRNKLFDVIGLTPKTIKVIGVKDFESESKVFAHKSLLGFATQEQITMLNEKYNIASMDLKDKYDVDLKKLHLEFREELQKIQKVNEDEGLSIERQLFGEVGVK